MGSGMRKTSKVWKAMNIGRMLADRCCVWPARNRTGQSNHHSFMYRGRDRSRQGSQGGGEGEDNKGWHGTAGEWSHHSHQRVSLLNTFTIVQGNRVCSLEAADWSSGELL